MRAIFLLLLCAMTAQAADAADKSFVLATTTSLEDSGLLSDLLPRFTKETGIEVRVVAQGTGQALDTARTATPISCWCTIPTPRRNSCRRASA